MTVSPARAIAGVVYRLLSLVLGLVALCSLFGCVFAAIGGPDGKLGSRESIEWAAGYGVVALVGVVGGWWMHGKARVRRS